MNLKSHSTVYICEEDFFFQKDVSLGVFCLIHQMCRNNLLPYKFQSLKMLNLLSRFRIINYIHSKILVFTVMAT